MLYLANTKTQKMYLASASQIESIMGYTKQNSLVLLWDLESPHIIAIVGGISVKVPTEIMISLSFDNKQF